MEAIILQKLSNLFIHCYLLEFLHIHPSSQAQTKAFLKAFKHSLRPDEQQFLLELEVRIPKFMPKFLQMLQQEFKSNALCVAKG